MSFALNRNKASFILFTILFRVLLEISYFSVVSEVYAYAGFLKNFDYANYLLSWIIFFGCFYFVRDRMYKISDFFFVFTFLSLITPSLIIFGYDSARSFVPILNLVISVLIIYLLVRTKTVSFKKLPIFKNGMSLIVAVSLIFVLFLVFWYFISGVTLNLSFPQVYDFRSENSDLSGGGILNYTNGWTYKIFNMALLAIALLYRQYFFAVTVLIVQVYFFAASTHKSVLFIPFLILGVWFYFRKTNSLAVIPIFFSSVIALTLVTYIMFGDYFLSSLFSRRVFFVPAQLTFVYFEFFSSNPHVYWSDSVLSSFSNYPYGEVSMSKLIGNYMGTEASANNGFISSGYAHAGIFGIYIYSIIIGFILRLLNDITYNLLPLWFSIALCLQPLRSLIMSSDLFTVMLTHGLIIVIIIIFFVRSKKYAKLKT